MQKNLNNQSQSQQGLSSSKSRQAKCYCSDQIIIRPELGQVVVAGHVARLTPVNMKVLTVLLDRAGEVVSRTDIYQLVWSNQIVSDDTLTRAISDIRAVFKSLAIESKLIETIPKKGYRWLAECKSDIEIDDSNVEPKNSNVNESKTIQQINTRLSVNGLNQADLPGASPSIQSSNAAKWFKWVTWSIAAIAFFIILAASAIWLVKNQFTDRYIKIAMMSVDRESPKYDELAIVLSEKLQQRVLKTTDIRLLSSRMGYPQQRSLIPYLADELSAIWVIEADIRETAGQVKITLNLVDAKSAVVLESVSQKIEPDRRYLEKLVERFVTRLVEMAEAR